MLYIFRVVSPGSDLDGEEWSAQAPTLIEAEAKVTRRLCATFELASPARRAATSLQYLATFASQRDYTKALDEARESGVALTSNDVDTVLATVLDEDFVDESRVCIGAEITGCNARIEPGASADPDVAVCVDCYGEGRQAS